mmetsp:Transcript_122861/g.244380  ORF Transcript_122861/g.244380 Transcript_122861/m.244380 type:complete len:159 (+) Transcript_122861:49-525(+)
MPNQEPLAIGFDPVQRAEAWKRRIDREELIVMPPLESLALPTIDERLDMLQETLHGGSAVGASTARSSARGSTTASSRSRCSGRLTAGVGRSIAQTPRTGGTPALSVRSGLSSRGAQSSRAGTSQAGSAILKAELEQETQRRQAAEHEIERLRAMLDG